MVYSLIFKANNPSKTHYRAKKSAEKNAPVAANPLLNVRFPIWVKILMFISMSER